MRRSLLLSFLLTTLVWISAIAQDRQVTGKVVSAEDGSSLPGVSIQVKGTARGTQTDASGNYSLNVPNSGATLVFSFIGTTTQEIAVGNRSTIDVKLANDTRALNEVVVVGYGTQQRRDLTGSQLTVKGDDIARLPVQTFETALQGRTPGVQITQGSGRLGSALQIRVRGAASISAGNEPLYVLDGIPITSQDVNTTDTELFSPLADIDPNDIESIEILKDASASSIYGSRASNGVVLITTKRGKAGRTNVQIGYYTGITNATRKKQFLNAAEYKELFSESLTNAGIDPNDPQDGFPGYGIDPNSTFDSDWAGVAFRQGAVNQANFGINGGNEKTRFSLTGATNKQVGFIVGNNFRRNNMRLNVDHSISNKFSVGASIAFSSINNKKVSGDNAFSNPIQLNALSPLQPIYNPSDPTGYNRRTLYYNNLVELDNAYNYARTFRTFGNLFGQYQLVPGLTFRSEYGFDILNLQEEIYRGRLTEDGAPTGYGYQAMNRVNNWTTNNTLTYLKNIGTDHSVDVLAGITYQEQNVQTVSATGRNFPNDKFKELASASQKTDASSSETGYSILSYLARANYKYKDRYLLTLTGRVDGSSRFGADNRYGFFPSASVGWILNEEAFIKNTLPSLSLLKLRASYGVTGNSEIDNFASRGLYGTINYGDQVGIRPSQVANAALRWEKSTQLDLGLEFGFRNNRINGQIDFYNKITDDLLLNVPQPAINGFTNIFQNIGSMRNRGVEFSITSQNLIGALRWSTNFNISFNRNKVTRLDVSPIRANSRFLSYVTEGQPLGVFYGKKYVGVNPQNGDAQYEGADGQPTSDYASAPEMFVGNPNPDFTGGLNNTFSYKGFDLSFLFQFVYGNDLFNVAGIYQSVNGNYFDNQTKDQMNRWQKPGDITNVPRAEFDAANGSGLSSRWMEDGSFLRLKTVSLGYNLPSSLLKKAFIQSARVYVSGLNLLTFTKYTGYDPEVNTQYVNTTNQVANIALGHDFYTPPQARTFTFGVNLGF
ncbi:TonB-linked SusC/RagA family outer membrane protein [Larkinella arboricola]|uniref:TonB-linked SusC/RagA family outer membrane protein n=1 Tax=Larkinella arboricola TaxID=643671 RepID=A0A327WTR0_LARAB|nr:TonB-dependent receptor [Larkinella arboricola]RAJ94411.1 TonB-linked SusC/RagA family outer membrane protein [Larkinella arboricola]